MDFALQSALRSSLLRPLCGSSAPALAPTDEAQFQAASVAALAKIPGLALPLDQLLADDPVECDPLIAHGNLILLRLDELFRQSHEILRKALENPSQTARKQRFHPPASGESECELEKTELTTKDAFPNPAFLGQAVNVLLASFRIQATMTHRRDQLLAGQSSACPSPASGARQSPESSPTPPGRHRAPRSADAIIRGVARVSSLAAAQPHATHPSAPAEIPAEIPAQSAAFPTQVNEIELPQASPKSHRHMHPQFTWIPLEGEKEWPKFIPEGVDLDADPESDEILPDFPVYARPPGPNERIQKFPPFAPAEPEDIDEIEAYLASLPPEITDDKNFGGQKVAALHNGYLRPPLWRSTQTELQYNVKQARLNRAAQRKNQASLSAAQALPEDPPFHKRE